MTDSQKDAKYNLGKHLELLNAYAWHKQSADRQQRAAASLRNGSLSDSECYVHFDFKENIKYPMGPVETGDMWHAQNKLSIACWGCVAMVPAVGGGHLSVYMLYCSVVLDHDTLAAKMYLEQCLADLRACSGADWARVKTLRLVSDASPHFRSYESMAHYCVDIPRDFGVDVCSRDLAPCHRLHQAGDGADSSICRSLKHR